MTPRLPRPALNSTKRSAPHRRNGLSVLRLKDDALYGDGVYQALKEAITEGRIPAGGRLRELELAAQFGVSRTPVREALKRLSAEGFVVQLPRQGLAVAEPSPEEIMDAYLVREAIEGLAARLAAERARDTDLMRLDVLLRQTRAALDDGALQRAIDLSNEFDRTLFRAAGSARLSKMIDEARAIQGRSLRASLSYSGRLAQTIEERTTILKAIRDRQPEAAEKAVREHLRQAREARIAMILNASRPVRTT
jgi:DNA-binding GntR family transcriptional regulator